MKKLIPFFYFLLFTFEFIKAQAPQATSYQAVIRNSSGNLLANQLVKVRFSIHDSAANGTVVYQETQTPTTNTQGLINLFAGQGTAVTGTFAGINWGSKSKYLQTEIDITGGNNYTDMGTTQLMSVPYSLYSNTANTATTAANGNPNGTAVGEMLYWNGTTWVKLNPGTNGQSLIFCNGVPKWGPCLILPTVLTGSITAKTAITATAGGNVTDSGSAKITARGVCFSTTINPTIANTKTASGTNVIGAFTVSLTGLTALTTYHYRAYATTSVGTSYGADSVFTTNTGTVPTLATTAASSITSTTATSGGNITSDNGATITARGICWSTTQNPTIALTTKTIDGSGTGAFTSSINGLIANTTYYVRAYATNSAGTAYGTQISFTSASGVVSLPRVKIGTQVWSSSNLSVAKYQNGDPIPQVTNATDWANLTTGAWCWYNNDSDNYASTYGRLYNWYAVNDPRGLAPFGWHIPSESEWNKLVKYLDINADTTCSNSICTQSSISGGSMKSTNGFNAPNTGATNISGFTGLPGGLRSNTGAFDVILLNGLWWSSGVFDASNALSRNVFYNNSKVDKSSHGFTNGFSVRVLRDTTIVATVPNVTTSTVINITTTTANCGGNILSDGGGTILSRGVCWSTSPNPTVSLTTKTVDGIGSGEFSSSLTGLVTGTTYYCRAYATNNTGTGYGEQKLVIISNIAALPSTTIGTQIWTNTNLNVAKYRNGDVIPNVTDATQWRYLTTGAWCWYNNDSATYAATYGRLYNWYAVNDPRGLAPQGWHVPSNTEWNKLVKHIDASADTNFCFYQCVQSATAGGAMKSTNGWNAPNTGANNNSGFSGYPGGYRGNDGFYHIGYYGYWWTSVDVGDINQFKFYRFLYSSDSGLRKNAQNDNGYSVRVIKD